ncbi:MAG TPA: T9SS type A sorting domain-containing protein, partial [Bacteroidia bacterium]|nr:T9SS type A sorting domain-containing protein [Bacteroidia bacterium]
CTSSSSSIAVTVIDACCSSGNCGHNNGVAICHDGHTICVSPNAVAAHLAQGDQLGACDNNDHGHGHGYGDNDDHGHGHGDGDDHGHGHGNDDHGHGHGDRIAYIQGDSTNTVVNAYPNPFDNSVNVQVSVTNDEPVRVEVKDIFGRTIAVIQDGNLSAGTYQYTWTPGSDVASGVYFIDTVCGGEHQVTKLVYQGK